MADALGRRVDGGLIGDVELEDSRIALDARRGPPPCSRLRDPTSTVKPCAGPKRLLGTARVPGVAWPSVDGLEHGWPGSVGVVGAECHLFAGLVLGALHVEFHADSPVGVAAENHPVTGFV